MFGAAQFGQPYPAQGYPGDTGVVAVFGDVIVATLADGNPTLGILDSNVDRTMQDGNPTFTAGDGNATLAMTDGNPALGIQFNE